MISLSLPELPDATPVFAMSFTEGEIVFAARTRGGKYAIEVTFGGYIHGKPSLAGRETTNGRGTGGFGGTPKSAALRTAQIVHDSAFCDGINYIIETDKLNVAGILARVDKNNWFPASIVNAAYAADYPKV